MEEQHLVSWSQRNATKGEAMPILLIFGFISLIGVVLLLALSLLIGFITAPLRTLALVIEKLCGVVAVVFIIVGVIMYFDSPKTFFKEHDTWMFILAVIGLAVLAAFCNWFRTRPTRADRRAAQQAEEERQRQAEQRVYDQLAYEQRLREAILAQQMQQRNPAATSNDPQPGEQRTAIIDTTLADGH
jgi:ABC-type nickel/cobalt efflux system permease component RcnA